MPPRPHAFRPALAVFTFFFLMLLAPADARAGARITVNTNADDTNADNFITLREAILLARSSSVEGSPFRPYTPWNIMPHCLTNAERRLVAGVNWTGRGDGAGCWTPNVVHPAGPGVGDDDADDIVFAAGVTTIMLTGPLPGLGVNDDIDGILPGGGKAVLDGSGAGSVNNARRRAREREVNASDPTAGVNGLFLTSQTPEWCEDNDAAYGPTTSRIMNLVIQNFTGHGIEGVGVQRALFQGLEIRDNGGFGIFLHSMPCYRGSMTWRNSYGNVIGGSEPSQRNFIHGNLGDGIRIVINTTRDNPAAHNYRIENNVIGLRPDGNANSRRGRHGIHLIDVRGSTVGSDDTASGNVIVGQLGDGIHIEGRFAQRVVVRNNLVGVSPNGTAVIGNGETGVWVGGAARDNTIIGNVITGNRRGVALMGAASGGNLVRGNFIGTNAALTPRFGNTLEGVLIEDAANNVVGAGRDVGADGEGNTIAFNGTGVRISGGAGNTVRRNAIFSNTTAALDLGAPGRSSNDAGDADAGANNGQNFPETIGVLAAGGFRRINGRLNSLPNQRFRVDYFISSSCTENAPEGRRFFHTTEVRTDASGGAAFTLNFSPSDDTNGQFLTATATNLETGDTSEFSGCFRNAVPSGALPGGLRPAVGWVNCAQAARGATATASSTGGQSRGLDFSVAGVINGDRRGLNWEHGGGWRDGTDGVFPDWVEVTLPGRTSINAINVFTVQDDYANPAEPDEQMMFTLYGVTDFSVQRWDGAGWLAWTGSSWVSAPEVPQMSDVRSVTGNRHVVRSFTFPPVTASKIRLVVYSSVDRIGSRVVELEAICRPVLPINR
jgi:parallel beta-helix repeat protein